jgi:retinol-binding protein 3
MSTNRWNGITSPVRRRSTFRWVALLFLVLLGDLWVGQKPVAAQMQHGPGQVPITATHQAAIIDSLARTLNEYYVFPDKAREMEKLVRSNLKKGEYKSIATLGEFAVRLTQDFQSVNHDLHLNISPGEPRQADGQDSTEAARRRERYLKQTRADNFGFSKIEILPGNIGYLGLTSFQPAEMGGATAVAAMNFLANVDMLIVDLRNNGGGEPSMIQLISSYLFDTPQHLNNFYIRRGDSIQQFWTSAYVEGPRLSNVPVYVLTSRRTFSGAEEFSYNLKNMKRATIVGDTTGGGAHPTDDHWFRIDDQVFVDAQIPYGRAVNPITGTNWEGTGVYPDIAVPSGQALERAQLDYCEKRLQTEKDEDVRFRLEWNLKSLQAGLNPVVLPADSLAAYAGSYGPRNITVENGALCYQRQDRPKFKLVPLGGDLFELDGVPGFRLQFVRDAQGSVTELVGQYEDGRTDSNTRSK